MTAVRPQKNEKESSISNPDKALYPKNGISKQDIADYFEKIADTMLPYLKDRPLTLRRYPDGIEEEGFYNKHAPDYFPAHIKRLTMPMKSKEGETIEMVSADNAEDLVYFADQAALEIHMGLSTARDFEKPDQMIFDLDPSDDDFEKIRKTALVLKDILDEKTVYSAVKTTGSRGLHIHVPLKAEQPFDEIKPKAKALAEALVSALPDITTLEQRKNKRGDKVFIDYLRNDYGMTAIAPYSLRGLPAAPIATPLEWAEVENAKLTPQCYNIDNIFRRLAQTNDPWEGFKHHATTL